jgi:Uma2 family endonuclease
MTIDHIDPMHPVIETDTERDRDADEHSTPETDPFFYGSRYAPRKQADGSVEYELVPLTPEDVLHPQIGDFIVNSHEHEQVCAYLFAIFKAFLAHDPSAVVLHNVLVKWGVRGMKGHGPDIAVFSEVPQQQMWRSFNIWRDGGKPELVIEVTSLSTRQIDLVRKFEHYHRAGIPLYIIIDLVRTGQHPTATLTGYRHTPARYERIPLDERGWLWVGAIGLWLGIDRQKDQVACYHPDGTRINDYTEETQARRAAEAHRDAEMQARRAAEAHRDAEMQARQAAEERLHELEAELHRLRGETDT